MIVTKHKLFSLMVLLGMLVGSIFPFFHEESNNNNFDNVSNFVISIGIQEVELSHDDSHHLEDIHCETCHIFYHLYSNPYQLTLLNPVGYANHHNTTDIFIDNAPDAIDRPPQSIG